MRLENLRLYEVNLRSVFLDEGRVSVLEQPLQSLCLVLETRLGLTGHVVPVWHGHRLVRLAFVSELSHVQHSEVLQLLSRLFCIGCPFESTCQLFVRSDRRQVVRVFSNQHTCMLFLRAEPRLGVVSALIGLCLCLGPRLNFH